jgi:hypothetical protein
MTSKQITAVAIKYVAIYLLFQAVLAAPMWIFFAQQSADPERPWTLGLVGETTLIVIVTNAILIGFALLAWTLSNRLVLHVTTPPVDDIHVRITPRGLQEILFRVLGVYLAVTYLSSLLGECSEGNCTRLADIPPLQCTGVCLPRLRF